MTTTAGLLRRERNVTSLKKAATAQEPSVPGNPPSSKPWPSVTAPLPLGVREHLETASRVMQRSEITQAPQGSHTQSVMGTRVRWSSPSEPPHQIQSVKQIFLPAAQRKGES